MSGRPIARRTRVWMLATLAAALGAGWVLGLAMGREETRAPTYLEQLTEALDLRPEQVAVVEALLEEEDREIDRWLEQSLDGLRERVAERRARTEQGVLDALDAEQRATYDQLAQGAGEGNGR